LLVVLLFNLVVLVLAARTVGSHQGEAMAFRTTVLFFFILGLTWVLALVVAADPSNVAAQYLFALVNTLQGVYVFAVQVYMGQERRHVLYVKLLELVGREVAPETTAGRASTSSSFRRKGDGKASNFQPDKEVRRMLKEEKRRAAGPELTASVSLPEESPAELRPPRKSGFQALGGVFARASHNRNRAGKSGKARSSQDVVCELVDPYMTVGDEEQLATAQEAVVEVDLTRELSTASLFKGDQAVRVATMNMWTAHVEGEAAASGDAGAASALLENGGLATDSTVVTPQPSAVELGVVVVAASDFQVEQPPAAAQDATISQGSALPTVVITSD
jgi:hypothetical protein